MPPAPSTFRMRYEPSRPSSSGPCGGARSRAISGLMPPIGARGNDCCSVRLLPAADCASKLLVQRGHLTLRPEISSCTISRWSQRGQLNASMGHVYAECSLSQTESAWHVCDGRRFALDESQTACSVYHATGVILAKSVAC